MKQLTVYFHEKPAGVLLQDRLGKYSFQYDADWLASTSAHPISQSLPLREAVFEERECAGYFGGLLPEDYNRELVARNIGITPYNDYAMLKVIGGECAGAVSILDPEAPPPSAPTASYQAIPLDELESILDTLPRKPLLAGEAEIRLSLAGAQNKLALHSDENGFALPLHESPSTHILKPDPEAFPGLVENEAFCLRIAGSLGLPSASAEAVFIGKHKCLLVKRYDRINGTSNIRRLHQEDFCQALGISSRYKYQAEGGPSLKQCFDLVRAASSSPAKDLIILFEAILFNFLIGNNDAHGKNFSLLYAPGTQANRVVLAPLYDLVSTVSYPGLSPRMAMKIGSKYVPADLRLRHWEAYWKTIGFSPKQALKQTLKFLEKVDQAVLDVIPTSSERPIQEVISERCRALSRTLKG